MRAVVVSRDDLMNITEGVNSRQGTSPASCVYVAMESRKVPLSSHYYKIESTYRSGPKIHVVAIIVINQQQQQ